MAANGAAVPVILPGAPKITCNISPYDNAWRWTIVFPSGKTNVQGIWSDHLESASVDGTPVIKRVQAMSYVRGKMMQLITTLDPTSCAPVSTERHGINGDVYKRTFVGARTTTERSTPGAAPSVTTVELATPVFAFNDGEDALLLASLPLRPGYEATIQSIDEMTSSDLLKPLRVRVVRREHLTDTRGRTEAFVVEVDDGESTSTLWISKAPPYTFVLRLRFTTIDIASSSNASSSSRDEQPRGTSCSGGVVRRAVVRCVAARSVTLCRSVGAQGGRARRS